MGKVDVLCERQGDGFRQTTRKFIFLRQKRLLHTGASSETRGGFQQCF